MSIADNLRIINENIARAAQKSGRQRADITLIAVTKSVDPQVLQGEIGTLLSMGVSHLGENRVQELTAKQPLCGSDITWHMIGNLQRNKVRNVVGRVAMIHSLDSLRLAEEISRIALRENVAADVLIEINIADEASKHGIAPEDAMDLAREAARLPNIAVKGLMTIAPFVDDGEENRPHFRRMARLFAELKAAGHDMRHLSMGMTIDYEVAIEEGATMVRIGTAIFGEREAQNEQNH
ncbi:MAG: YggS family pyridoxal phosphate-dependent enzyme [Clostridiales bacterium]|jgi:pyridoxal phosphate enzyme (YggS family)|nr:YggS family pyridoxal phosphate-dependent enzyme [Clostridiales bacterium]